MNEARRKRIPHNVEDLFPLVSEEVYLSTGNSQVIFGAVYKSPDHASSDADIIELLSLRIKSLLAKDLNAKYFGIAVSKLSGEKILELLDINEFKDSAP
jgi:hypothetical protein